MYGGLSKIISLGNRFLIGKYDCNIFKVNESFVIDYSRLQENRFDIIREVYRRNTIYKISYYKSSIILFIWLISFFRCSQLFFGKIHWHSDFLFSCLFFYISVLDFVFCLPDYVTKHFRQCNRESSNSNI